MIFPIKVGFNTKYVWIPSAQVTGRGTSIRLGLEHSAYWAGLPFLHSLVQKQQQLSQVRMRRLQARNMFAVASSELTRRKKMVWQILNIINIRWQKAAWKKEGCLLRSFLDWCSQLHHHGTFLYNACITGTEGQTWWFRFSLPNIAKI